MLHLPYFTPKLPYYLHSSLNSRHFEIEKFISSSPSELDKTLAIIVDFFADELKLESKIESSLLLQNLNLFAE